MTLALDLTTLLDDLDALAKTELASSPDVEDWDGDLDVGNLPITARRWVKVPDLVAVFADLKNSTQLGTGKHAASTARIYQAATGGVVNVMKDFAADFMQIQGDGVFGLFWRDQRYERALCAGITAKTYSEALVQRMDTKWPDGVETGLKVGIASSRILVKRIGVPRDPAQNEPVWAGKAVNYAAKAAQQADRHQMIVTASVWKAIQNNDYLAISCPCGTGPSAGIWEDVDVERLPEDDDERKGRMLGTTWCTNHGSDYCSSILAGEATREDAKSVRAALNKQAAAGAMESKRQQDATDLRNRRVGLRR